jgi:hypothetical protein
VLLVVTGGIGAAMTISWMRFAEGLQAEDWTGLGMRLALVASLLQAAIGLVGVTTRNWWHVYAVSIAALAVLLTLVWAYVFRGLSP